MKYFIIALLIALLSYDNFLLFKNLHFALLRLIGQMMWTIWAKALGSKAFDDDNKADKVAIVRSVIVLFEIIVGVFIILNAISNHGWGLIGL